MQKYPICYLTQQQAVDKYPFLSLNMLKNLLFKNIGGFRTKVVHRIGRRLVLNEEALLRFIDENKEGSR